MCLELNITQPQWCNLTVPVKKMVTGGFPTQRASNAETVAMSWCHHAWLCFSVVSVGGDGMFSEMMHGLLTRSMRDAGIEHLTPGQLPPRPTLRIGIIPGGEWELLECYIQCRRNKWLVVTVLGEVQEQQDSTGTRNICTIQYNIQLHHSPVLSRKLWWQLH